MLEHVGPDGEVVRHLARRFLPHPASLRIEGEARSAPGERLDLVSARALGDPAAYWRLCDANGVSDPAAVDLSVPRRWRVPYPEARP